ncbi:MAG: Large exoproteins involved in heme utilization or adhesion [uncultured Paraburkholderia sp.]|nr:MAG: Large exoproteins involved in heme utilization or adhesion [uncultured Paraburkholderia sp.]CAH2940462.1 MAG: Large exoproteins involved in heme utilization or adhesion [uncultured Paraburkholderia sp.]
MAHPPRTLPVQRIWLSIGLSLQVLSLAHVACAAGALPQGGAFAAGSGTIAGRGNSLVITQPGSTRDVIDWNSFSIGPQNRVVFDNGSGATLNCVTGGSPSLILGRLSATGSVYLINPQGVLVGPSGTIATGGRFVASTLDAADAAFMAGGPLTLTGDSNAPVANLGKIDSSGGDVFLVSAQNVTNTITVDAPNGTVEFAAGRAVLLQDSPSDRQVFVQTSSGGSILDAGMTRAAQISLQAVDGNVYALADGGARIRATGTGTRDGHLWLLAGNGQVYQQGTLTASSTGGTGSGNSTVTTQASNIEFAADAVVEAAQWSLSTPAITIGADTANALARSLDANTAVNLSTTGGNGTSGDLQLRLEPDVA